jgi:ubiquinone/menaquinone biosynthesis C-methylase UbiE
MKRILDVGCGNVKYVSPGDEVIGIDKRANTAADKIVDIDNEKFPFPDNYFDKVVTIHTLEHVKDLVKVMEEIWRVCKPGAEIFINVPYWVSSGSYSDPTHERFITYNTFDYFTKDFEYEHYSECYFKIKKRKIMFYGENVPPKYKKILKPVDIIMTSLINIFPIFYQSTGFVYLFPAREIHFWLEAVK